MEYLSLVRKFPVSRWKGLNHFVAVGHKTTVGSALEFFVLNVKLITVPLIV